MFKPPTKYPVYKAIGPHLPEPREWQNWHIEWDSFWAANNALGTEPCMMTMVPEGYTDSLKKMTDLWCQVAKAELTSLVGMDKEPH